MKKTTPEDKLAKARAWRLANKEKLAEYYKKWSNDNAQKLKDYEKDKYQKNKEKIIERSKNWYQQNTEKANKRSNEYAKKNPDQIKATQKKFYESNKEKVTKWKKKWVKNNPEKMKQLTSDWGKLNRDKTRAYCYNRRLKISNASDEDAKDVAAFMKKIMLSESNFCEYCGDALTKEKLQFDHVFPIKLGGAHTVENLAVSCKKCNNSKSAKILGVEWFPKLWDAIQNEK